MKNSHTPGPWKLGSSTESDAHGDFKVYGPDFGHFATGQVATVERRASCATALESFDPQIQRLTAEANARLIAASPELARILTNCLGALEACEIVLHPKSERARLSADIRDAREILSKL